MKGSGGVRTGRQGRPGQAEVAEAIQHRVAFPLGQQASPSVPDNLVYVQPAGSPPRERVGSGLGSVQILAVMFVLVVLIPVLLPGVVSAPWLQEWATIFLSV